jgi:hypothetical protein
MIGEVEEKGTDFPFCVWEVLRIVSIIMLFFMLLTIKVKVPAQRLL